MKISRRNFIIGGVAAGAAIGATAIFLGIHAAPKIPSSSESSTTSIQSSSEVPPSSTSQAASTTSLQLPPAQSETSSTEETTASSSTTIVDSSDYEFFYEPYSSQVEELRSWLMQPWSESSSDTFGFDDNYQMVRGGSWPGYSDALGNSFGDGYHPGMVIIDNNFQHGLTLDWLNSQKGITTEVNKTVRGYLDSTQFVDPDVDADPSTEAYDGTDRRETFFGRLSPSYGNLPCIKDTASQIWYVPGHTLSDLDPIVTALPTKCLPDGPSSMETFAPKILLEYMQGNVEQATSDFLGVINSWQPGTPGQLGAPYDTTYKTRSLDFSIVVARCCKDTTGTYFWQRPDIQPTLQQIIETLWTVQQSDGSVPTTYAPSPLGSSPESVGEALLAFDPNLPSRFP